MGMPVPTWTRCVQWNVGQQARFITAVWAGLDLGSYLTNDWCEPASTGRAFAENSEILIDGQQRLHSLEEYFLDRLAVPDAQSQPRVWSELGNGERKRFLSTILRRPGFLLATKQHCEKRMIFARRELCLGHLNNELFGNICVDNSRAAPFGGGCREPSPATTGLRPAGYHPSALRPSWSARSACI